MDPLSAATAILLGAVAGLLTGLVPGLHVNTLIPVTLAMLPAAGPAAALGLVAVGTVHTFVAILPATYLGAPGEDTALAVLPAHRMLLEGRGPEAIHLSVHASLLAALGAVVLVLPYKWLLGEPGRALAFLEAATPVLLCAVLVLLLIQERRVQAARARRALLVQVLAGWLGVLALDWQVQGSGSPLLPLLAGLYGAPTLLHALRSGRPLPPQLPLRRPLDRPAGRASRHAWKGVGAAAWTAVLPGLTAAVATAVARPFSKDTDARPVVVLLSAVNTAHATFALAVLWLVGVPRTGLAHALPELLTMTSWDRGAPPEALLWVLSAVVASAALGTVGTLLLDRGLRPWVPRLPGRALQAGAMLVLVGLTLALTGATGGLLLVTATVVGLVPLALGVRRVHLAAALLVPLLARVL